MLLRASLLLGLLPILIAGREPQEAPPASPRPKAFWRAIVTDGYRVPEGESPFALIVELSAHLGSPDPELRDDCGYSIPARWIEREQRLDGQERRALAALWLANLERGLGDEGEDSVLLRSFSALDLSLLAASDLADPFLDDEGFEALLWGALDYLDRERDLRGWTPELGWVHAVAHTADLLKFLARSPRLRPEGQVALLEGIARKAVEPSGRVFTFGEPERLAAAALSVFLRDDFQAEARTVFLDELTRAAAAHRAQGLALDPVKHAAARNAKLLLRALLEGLVRRERAGARALSGPVLDALTRF